MKTIAQELNVKEFPFSIKDSKGKIIYFEDSTGYWDKYEFDSNGKKNYYENSNGYWEKQEYDSNGNVIYYEDSTGYWYKHEFNSNGKLIYYENSNEDIEDNRQKTTELTMDEIALKFNIKVEDLKIKKYR